MKNLGLALGGGGLKGLAHIGALQVLEEQSIPVAQISGTSSGSIIAALYASGMSARRMEEVTLRIFPRDYLDYNYTGLLNFLAGLVLPGRRVSLDGIIKGEKLEKLVYELTGGRHLQDARIPLAIIACDIDTGREVIFTNQGLEAEDERTVIIHDALLSEAVRASVSIPATFVPLSFRTMQLVDGGLRSMVPVKVQKMMGAEYVLAISLGGGMYDRAVEGIPEIVSRTIDILTYESSDTDLQIFADLVVSPEIGPVKLDEWSKAPSIIRTGRRAMREKIPQLQKGLRQI